MTREQGMRIQKMRAAGSTYSLIAENVGLSINTVKSYCRRREMGRGSSDHEDTDYRVCKCCGKKLVAGSGQKKKFCNDSCRMKWWNEHPKLVDRRAIYSFNCACCGKNFTAYGNNHRKYCSRGCYINGRYGGDAHDS